VSPEDEERARVQALLDAAWDRWGAHMLDMAEQTRRAEAVWQERGESADFNVRDERELQRWARWARWLRTEEVEREIRIVIRRAEARVEGLLLDVPEIHDEWRRLHETGFHIEGYTRRRAA
jgi:hypothetical protein